MENNTKLPDEIKDLAILVAENNPALLKNMVKALKNAGATHVIGVEDGVAAWHEWRKDHHVAVMIIARNLPEMGGLEILERVRQERDPKLSPAFVFISQESSPQVMNQALDNGADVFLAKPFSTDLMVDKVVEAVECRKQILGKDAFKVVAPPTEKKVEAHIPVALLFERTAQKAECEEVSASKCIIRAASSFGLGSTLTLQFPSGPGGAYPPVKGLVTKEERVAGEIGVYRIHLSLQPGPKKSAPPA